MADYKGKIPETADRDTLQNSEALSRAVLSSLTAHIAVLNREGEIIVTNSAWDRFARENGEEHLARTGVGANYLQVCREARGEFADEARVALVGLEAVLNGSEPQFSLEYPCHSSTEKRWFLMHATLLSGGRQGVVVAHINITERRQVEEEKTRLFEAVSRQQAQLRALAGRLAEAQEAERKRLAQELHDQVGQNLTALGLNLNIIRSQLSARASAPIHTIQARLEDSLTLVDQTTERIRDVMGHLRPSVLDDYGLVAGLNWYGEQLAGRAGLKFVLHGHEPAPRLPAPAENALFRIAQEALTNAAKHSGAGEVVIIVELDDTVVRLVVTDNGQGFDPARLTGPGGWRGWGLMTMTERAEAVGGHCRIESSPGHGARVIVEVPRSARHEQQSGNAR